MKVSASFVAAVAIIAGLSVYLVIPPRVSHGNLADTPAKRKALRERNERNMLLGKQEMQAESEGNYKAAEAIYNKFIAEGEPAWSIDRSRYSLYEKEGREKDAYLALKNYLENSQRRSFGGGYQERDLWMHYASLSEKYGDHKESLEPYLKIIGKSRNNLDRDFQPSLTTNGSRRQVLAAAFYAVGIDNISRGRVDSAVEYMRNAVSLNPKSWLCHFGLAFSMVRSSNGGQEPELVTESLREYKQAESLAPAELRTRIQFAPNGSIPIRR